MGGVLPRERVHNKRSTSFGDYKIAIVPCYYLIPRLIGFSDSIIFGETYRLHLWWI